MLKDFRDEYRVIVEEVEAEYPREQPYHPSVAYPEYKGKNISNKPNQVYDGIRRLFHSIGFDQLNYGSSHWNPLGELINPGDTVLIKPNIVRHYNGCGYNTDSLITHGSIVRCVADYALLAIKNQGRVIIGDAPLQSCDIKKANNSSGVSSVLDYYMEKGEDVQVRDFRVVTRRKRGRRGSSSGDPTGVTYFDIGEKSLHHEAKDFKRFRVTDYNPSFMLKYQNSMNHTYIIANSIFDADVVICLPKLKTHRKAGITGSLKNNIGINAHKDCLPHHKRGSLAEGGDEYQYESVFKDVAVMIEELEDRVNSSFVYKLNEIPKRLIYAIASKFSNDLYYEGSWWGNDTIWRTLIDLNNILFFGNQSKGKLEDCPVRRFLCIVDSVIAGEGEGPLEPTPKKVGLLIAGLNPVAVDIVCSRIMGFDWRKIPSLAESIKVFCRYPTSQIECFSSSKNYNGHILNDQGKVFFKFEPTKGWKNHIEIDQK